MNFFKRLFGRNTATPYSNMMEMAKMKHNERLPLNTDFSKPILINRPQTAHPENAHGGFYVMNDACITCGTPEAEAPDLIEHSRKMRSDTAFLKSNRKQKKKSNGLWVPWQFRALGRCAMAEKTGEL